MATNVISDMLRQKEKPNKRSKEGGTKGSVVCLKILIRENLVYVKRENWDQDTPSNSPKAPGTKSKFGKERVHRKELRNSTNLKIAIRVPQIQGGVTRGNLAPRRMRPRSSMGFGENIFKLKNSDKTTFYTPIEAQVMLAPTSTRPEEREFVVDSGASMHMISKKDLS